MEERSKSLKRKRENDYPRITFTTGARTFDRLLKESTLDGLKEGVRKKLGYASEVPLQFAQLRDGKAVDLEDDDDFEAFCAAASSTSDVTVLVNAPADAPHFTPARTTPLPHTRSPSVQSPKKRKKKKKATADDKPEDPVEAAEKPGQKRKAPPTEPEDNAPEPQQTDAPPPKKRKKKNAIAQELPAPSADKPEELAAEPAGPTGEKERALEETAKESKKRKKARKSAALPEETAEHTVPATAEQEPEDSGNAKEEAGKAKEKGKKKEKAKEVEKVKEVERDKSKTNAKETGKGKAKGKAGQTAGGGSDLGTLIEDYEKKVAAEKKAEQAANTPEDSDSPSHSSDADDNAPLTEQGKTTGFVQPASKETVINGKTKGTKARGKAKAKEAESAGSSSVNDLDTTLAECINAAADANSTAPPQPVLVEVSGKKTKATKKHAKEVPAPANKADILASMDAMLAAKKRDQASVIVKPTEGVSPAVASAPPKKAAAVAAKEKATLRVSALSAAPKRSAAPEESDESSTEEPAPVVSAVPKSTTSRGRRPDICPLCEATPAHTRSRCSILRQALKSSRKFLQELQAKQAEHPTSFRESQIKAVEELVKEKEAKKKGVSDEGDVVTGIDAPSAVSAKPVTTATVTTETISAKTKQKPGAQANHTVANISASTARLVYTPPLDGDSNDLTTGPSATQQQQKQAPSTLVSAHPGSQQPPPVLLKADPTSKLPRTRNDSSSESSESSEDESPNAHVPTSKIGAAPKSAAPVSASTALSNNTAQRAARSKGPIQGKSTYQWPGEDAFSSISRGSSSQSSRTVVAPPPPPRQPQVSTKSQKPHPLSQIISSRATQKAQADSDSEDDSGEEDQQPAATQPISVFSAGLPDLSNVSLADIDLDAVIRGPRVSISTKELPSSDSGENDEDEDASVDAEGLADDDEPEASRRTLKMFNAAAVGSSDEEESDGDDGKNVEDAPAQRPPRLSLSAVVKSKPQSDHKDEDNDEEEAEDDEQESRQDHLEHGNLSFGDVNGMASSVEIDSRGDRAFSEALADDTAVFNLAAPSVEASSRESSGRNTPENPAPVEDQDEEGEEEETTTAKPAKDDRHDSIEPFDSPIKSQAPPRSPIVDADVLQSTPRSLRSRMKGKDGKVPLSPVTPAAPNPSMKKAMNLWIGLGLAEKEKKAREKAAKEKAKVAAQPTPPAEAAQQEEEPEPEPEKPVRGKRAAAAKAAKLTSQSLKPLSTRSQKAPAATQPAPSVKPMSKAARSSKAPPASQPLPAVTPGRTTRAAAKRAASVQPEDAPAPPPPTQVTQESVHKWETLQADSSSQPDETMNMVDELQSVPEEDDENLFIASETQQSFPYSQWQTEVKEKKELHYATEEEEEDEEDEVLHALNKSTKATPMKKKSTKYNFLTLSQLTMQGRTFRTSLPTAGVPKPGLNRKRRETMADLVGLTGGEPSDESGADNSDSGSDAEKPAPSHIPKGRRAGVRARG